MTVADDLRLPHYPVIDGVHPPLEWPDYRSTRLRAPSRALLVLAQRLTEVTGPVFGDDRVRPDDHDLTLGHPGEPLGQRIVIHGRVLDQAGRPVSGTLLEVWQANAAGRYRHARDTWPAPLDPNFTGAGRTLTGADGGYRIVTVRPGAYPWQNHHNAWRPAHIHFSVFGRAFATRLVTQMYFPDDPLFGDDPIFNAVADPRARQRMVARYDASATIPEWALAYRYDIVLRGPQGTPFEDVRDRG